MTAVGHLLYERLRSAPPLYRYALAGVETDLFRTYDDFFQRNEDLSIFPGLVVREEIWSGTGESAVFVPFGPGYRWMPYPGEVYHRPQFA
ncbi:hypothetical protein [Amycolatopsis sp. NPDC051071]|uniref:hypothetical protein n=1 Tax=Amycolatopsis sp. NPDC051071 TaxID=3154637 RepID=UPI00343E5C39